jgi:hypothetical protein
MGFDQYLAICEFLAFQYSTQNQSHLIPSDINGRKCHDRLKVFICQKVSEFVQLLLIGGNTRSHEQVRSV